MTRILFDDNLRRIRQERAARRGGDDFLAQRAFADCVDRLGDVRRRFGRALIAGRRLPEWAATLAAYADDVSTTDAPSFDPRSLDPGSADLCLTIGDLETINDLPAAAFALRHCLKPGGLLIGAITGGASLPRLRASMLAADRASGRAVQRLHPMIDGPSLGALLTSVGFTDPVIGIDRVGVLYTDLDRLIGDLRAMGCANALVDRPRAPINRSAFDIARREFLAGQDAASERFELIHFTAWAPEE